MKFEIKHRYDGRVLYSGEGETLCAVLEEAVRKKTDLRGSNLSYSNLSCSNLGGSNLRGSDLSGSNLSGSNLSYSNLSYSNLGGSNLGGSNLRGSDLSYSNLSGSNLHGSNLSYSNLRYSNLSETQADVYEVFSFAPHEVPGVLQALRDGKIDGSTYSGACACLVGTMCNLQPSNTDLIPRRPERLAERWFAHIRPGDTPANHPVAAIVETWIEEWLLSNPEVSS